LGLLLLNAIPKAQHIGAKSKLPCFTAQFMKKALKRHILQTLKHGLAFLDKNPALRRQVYFFICKYGMYNFLKKFYASRLQQTSTNQFSPLMVGPVVVLDISQEQLSAQAQEIYSQLKQSAAQTEARTH